MLVRAPNRLSSIVWYDTAHGLRQFVEPAYPTAYAVAVRHWGIAPREAVIAYLWSWLENQVMAAVKAVPLGQTAGQKILLELGSRLECLADVQLEKESWSNLAPGLAYLSSRHETQYSRLFRS